MTREEAIQALKEISATLKSWSGFSEYPQAIDMAIESLQKDIERHEMVIRASERHLNIVRCKDCKHRSDRGWCDVYIQPRMETDFCNHGERQCNYFGERGKTMIREKNNIKGEIK